MSATQGDRAAPGSAAPARLLLWPLLLAAGAVAERCSVAGWHAARDPASAPGAAPASAAPPVAPCPIDTLPAQGLCVPVPAVESTHAPSPAPDGATR